MRITRSVFTKIILAGLAVGIAVATLVFVTAPKHYRSEAFFTGRPSSQFTADVVEALKGNVFFSKEFLSSLILKRNLYPSERRRMPMDAVIDEMKRNIRVYYSATVSSEAELHYIHRNQDAFQFLMEFEYSDPRIAQEVNQDLVDQFIADYSALVDPNPVPDTFQIRMFDPPTVPLKPVEPSLARSSAIGLLGGLLTGLALVILAKLHRTATFANI
jgi:hypothetical protein